MDGLLLDTERLGLEIFLEVCTECGLDAPDVSVYHRCIGSTPADTRAILMNGYGPEFPFDRVAASWTVRYERCIEQGPVPLKAGAAEILEALSDRGVPCAVVTSTHTPLAERKLEVAGLEARFRVIVGGDQVARGKPAPDIYLRALALLGRNAAECLAVEDSSHGVRAAAAAGIPVIQIPDLVPAGDDLAAERLAVMSSLVDVLRLLG